MTHGLQQVRIVHVSDTHFGARHRFQAPLPPDGERPPSRGFPSMADSILRDLDCAVHPSTLLTGRVGASSVRREGSHRNIRLGR
jgi:hypothetical protein